MPATVVAALAAEEVELVDLLLLLRRSTLDVVEEAADSLPSLAWAEAEELVGDGALAAYNKLTSPMIIQLPFSDNTMRLRLLPLLVMVMGVEADRGEGLAALLDEVVDTASP